MRAGLQDGSHNGRGDARHRAATLAAASSFGALLLVSGPAWACSFASLDPHTTDPSQVGVDVLAPAAPSAEVDFISRGKGPRTVGCGGSHMSTSCDDLGQVSLRVAATDDLTAPGALGFRISVQGGACPLAPAAEAVRPTSGGTVFFVWIDGADDDQESFECTLELRAVDAAGNESAPTTLVVRDDGDGFGTSNAGLWLGASAMGLVWVRRRGRRPPQ